MRNTFLNAAASLIFLASASVTKADIVEVTYTGTVVRGFDLTGIFGKPGSYLAGDTYEAQYILNGNIDYQSITNGTTLTKSYFLPPLFASPVLSATITINGHSASIENYGGSVTAISGPTFSQRQDIANSEEINGLYNIIANSVSVNSSTLPGIFTSSITYKLQSGDIGFGNVNISGNSSNIVLQSFASDHLNNNGYGGLGTTYASAALSTLTVSAVPGPIAGAGLPALLGLLGFGLYRRRRPLCV